MILFHPEVLYQLPWKKRQHSIQIWSLT